MNKPQGRGTEISFRHRQHQQEPKMSKPTNYLISLIILDEYDVEI